MTCLLWRLSWTYFLNTVLYIDAKRIDESFRNPCTYYPWYSDDAALPELYCILHAWWPIPAYSSMIIPQPGSSAPQEARIRRVSQKPAIRYSPQLSPSRWQRVRKDTHQALPQRLPTKIMLSFTLRLFSPPRHAHYVDVNGHYGHPRAPNGMTMLVV